MRTLSVDTDPATEAVLVKLWRVASPAQKLARVVDANLTARALSMAGLARRHPADEPARLRRRLADLWLGPDLAAKAYGPLDQE